MTPVRSRQAFGSNFLTQDVEQNRPGKRGSHKKAKPAKKKAENDENEEEADVDGTPIKAKKARRRGKTVGNNENGEETSAQGTPIKAKQTKGRGKKVKTETNGDDDGLLPGSVPEPQKRKAPPYRSDDEEHEIYLPRRENLRKPSQLAHAGAVEENGDAPTPKEKPAKKSRAKKVKVEDKTEGQMNEPKNQGGDVGKSRVARNTRKKDDELNMDGNDGLGEEAPNVKQVDGTMDSSVTKPAKKGRPRKVKGEDAGEDARAVAGPAEPDLKEEEEEQQVAVAPGETEVGETKAKVGRKKGVAKKIARGRPSKWPCEPNRPERDALLTSYRTRLLGAFMPNG